MIRRLRERFRRWWWRQICDEDIHLWRGGAGHD
jgi:hypothetical protein